MKEPKNLFIILFWTVILVIAFFLFSGQIKQANNKIQKFSPEQGILDLSGWHPVQNGLVSLNGQWEFYWQKLFTYDDFKNNNVKPDLFAKTPEVWNRYKVDSVNLPGFGAATYRLKIKNAPKGQIFAIRMPTVSAAYNLYIDDRLIASNGKVGMNEYNYIPEYRPVMAQFIPPSGDFEIILQVANFTYARGGVWYPIFMGTSEDIFHYAKTIGYKDLFLVGALLMMLLYYLAIFLMRKEDRSSLYLVLLCMITIGRTVIYGDYIINWIFLSNIYHIIVAIDYLTLVWFPIALLFLIGEIFKGLVSPKLNKIFKAYGALMSMVIIFLPIHTYTSFTYPIEAVALAIGFYAVICAAKAYPDAKMDSAIIMTGALVAALGGIHDVLYQNNLISSSFGELSSFGFLILLFLQAFILARRFSEAFDESKILSEKLLKLDKMKDEFLANTSHELRTPLNAIINIAEGISRGTEGPVSDRQIDSLSMITTSGKRLTHLINDILDYSQLKNVDLKMNFEAVSLKRTVESVMNVLERLNTTAGLKLLIDLPYDLPDVHGDENRLIQILYNLTGNALKFTEAGYIKVWAARVGDIVEICVEDTGPGIPDDKIAIIFEPFRQLEDSLTRKKEGTGLGLSLSKYLIEAQGGNIRVESKVGIGSKFFFSIPVSTQAAEEKSWQYKTAITEIAAAAYGGNYIDKFPYRHEGNGPHIILVDDNKGNMLSLAAILELESYSVTAITSSAEFFEEFKAAGNVSLVILDIMLPGLSGYEICREIRKDFLVSELPVLMLTARTATHDIVMGMEAGANDYLSKPFDTEELLARVKTLISLKQSVDKAKASELAFLQAQIKPHFLYNALNTFVCISLYDIDKARNLIMEFGNYLRRSFDFKNLNQTVPLKNELELVRAYLEIEKARFEEKIEVVYDLPEDLEVQIPMLVLQPIIENALIHGILPKDEGGRIEICIRRVEEALYIKVKDNGVGMDPAMMPDDMRYEFGRGVGISNIDSRLRKLYGKGLQIDSSPGMGTEVTIYVPISSRGVN